METPGKIVSGVVAAVAAVVFGAAYVDDTERDSSGNITTAGEVGAFKIRVGDCLNDLAFSDAATTEFESVTGVPCSSPHKWEAYSSTELGLATYSEQEVIAAAQAYCDSTDALSPTQELQLQATYDAAGPELQRIIENLEVTFMFPSAESWDQGDRQVLCMMGSSTDFLTQKLF